MDLFADDGPLFNGILPTSWATVLGQVAVFSVHDQIFVVKECLNIAPNTPYTKVFSRTRLKPFWSNRLECVTKVT